MLPDFIIIGAQKGGTTSLYKHLTEHPKIIRTLRKEIHFFDNNFSKGLSWYQSHFKQNPLFFIILRKKKFKDSITGEASPYYIFHPHAPSRISKIIPNVKLIAMLRNPVDRAFSHYNHMVHDGHEHLSFEDAIKEEPKRLRGEIEKMLENETYNSFNHQYLSYVQRGIYIDQLERWIKKFPKEQILILSSEDFFSNTTKICNDVFSFLNLPNYNINKIKTYNKGTYKSMKKNTRKELIEFFEPYNEKLYSFLNKDLGWK